MAVESAAGAHPLLASFDLLRARSSSFGALVDAPEGEGWVELAWLLDPARPELAGLIDGVGAGRKVRGRSIPGLNLFGGYVIVINALHAACYLLFQRVPLFDAADLSLRFSDGGDILGVAIRSYRFAALPADPAAGHADCTLLESADALRDQLRLQLVALLEPLVDAIHRVARTGKPAMWAMAGDYVAQGFGWIGREAGNQAAGVAEVVKLTTPPSKLQRTRGFVHIEHMGQEYDMVDRVSCCLWYKVPDGGYCSACPHRPMEERVQKIKLWLATVAAQSAENAASAAGH